MNSSKTTKSSPLDTEDHLMKSLEELISEAKHQGRKGGRSTSANQHYKQQ